MAENQISNLWGDEFTIPVETKKKTKQIVKKIKVAKEKKEKEVKELSIEKQIKSKKISLQDRLEIIKKEVYRVLGKQKDNTIVIKNREQLTAYIDEAIKNGMIAVDTETNNSLDPTTCKLMGGCIYTNGQKQAYIPINHINNETKERLAWQLTEEDLKEEFQKLIDYHTKIIMHHGKFDYQVIKHTCNIALPIYWDTMLAAKLLDENEFSAGLKYQYITKIDPEQEKYDIEKLFDAKNVKFADIDPELFALYAATDSMMTYKLYEWQKEKFEDPDLKRIYNVLMKIEIPAIIPVAEMELTGVVIDQPYAKRLQDKYHNLLKKLDEKIKTELDKLVPTINSWKLTVEANKKPKKKTGEGFGKSKAEQLEDPVNLASPAQLAILLYDILKMPQVDKKSLRGTGEEILEKMAKATDLKLCSLLVERRGLIKLISTYIDNIPELAKIWPDGRIRTHFNQYGAATGRFSSGGKVKYIDKDGNEQEVSGVNMQNIPAHAKEIRALFTTKPEYILCSADFSQQEPRLLSVFSGDEIMMQSYKDGKDLYATIASGVYHNNYWDNMEHHQDGSPNPEGKKRRNDCKSILLGIMYGRGVASVAEQIKGTMEEAQSIINNFYKAFPKVKAFTEASIQMARDKGYVTDYWGRRRRLPDINLPKYEIKQIGNAKEANFNPLLECENKADMTLINKYQELLSKTKYRKEIEEIKRRAIIEGIEIKDNGGFIAQAERQCVNARIQGSAASMTKQALAKIYNDKEITDLGFKMSIMVHDEIIGECPEANKDKVAERLSYLMCTCVKDDVPIPFKCDATIEKSWYLTDYVDNLKEDYENLVKEKGAETAFEIIKEKYCESTPEDLKKYLEIA